MSHRILGLAPHAIGQPQRQIVYGQVCRPAPTSFTDPLYVITPDWSTEYYQVVHNWPRVHGNTLPALHAACELAKDDRGNVRVVWWDGVNT